MTEFATQCPFLRLSRTLNMAKKREAWPAISAKTWQRKEHIMPQCVWIARSLSRLAGAHGRSHLFFSESTGMELRRLGHHFIMKRFTVGRTQFHCKPEPTDLMTWQGRKLVRFTVGSRSPPIASRPPHGKTATNSDGLAHQAPPLVPMTTHGAATTWHRLWDLALHERV